MTAPTMITSRDNNTVKYACKLANSPAFRQQEQAFLAEGLKLCVELAANAQIRMVFYTEKALEKTPSLAQLGGTHYLIEAHVAEKLADARTPQGVFAVFETPKPRDDFYHAGGRYLALEAVQDPGNVGTLLRSAAAFGFDGVLLSKGCASPFAPKTLRASMGAAARIAIYEGVEFAQALQTLHACGVQSLAAALYQSEPLSAVPSAYEGGVCVVIGSEGQGLREETIAACDRAVRIPMTDRVESLNAGIAGSILLWHFRAEEL